MTDELHEQQLALERQMTKDGIKRFYDEIREAEAKGQGAVTPAMQTLLKAGIEPISKGIHEEFKKIKSDRAWVHGRIFLELQRFKPEVIAFIALKCIIQGVSQDARLNAMAIDVGSHLEDELMFSSYLKQNRPLMDKIRKNLSKRSTNYGYKKKVIVHSANKAGLEYDSWSTDYKLGLGLRLIDIVITQTNLFEIVHFKNDQHRKGRPYKRLVPTKKTVKWLLDKNEYLSVLRPIKLPMVVSPKPWTGLQDGGYFSLKSPLIRFKKDVLFEDYIRETASEECKFEPIMDVVNAIQETPWRVNKGVLEVIEHFWNTIEGDVLGPECLPRKEELVNTQPFPEEGTDEEKKEWKRVSTAMYNENVSIMSKKIAFHKLLWVTSVFKDYDRIYFPHNLDFRGRVYPINECLSPQGDDCNKGLLQFAEGKPITTALGKKYFLMYGASLYGHDKWSEKDKLMWVNTNLHKILTTHQDPLSYKWWAEADKPWQFLAWCLEYHEFHHNPDANIHLPVSVDGTCNGLQHLSALMKDPIGASAVNLIDTGDTPNDIYQMVSDEAKKHYHGPIKIDRKLCKQPVMTTPYGNTLYGMKDQVNNEVRKRNRKIAGGMEYSEDWDDIVKATDAITVGIDKVIHKSRLLMDWLKDIANVMAENSLPMSWMTPFGFYVYQTYPETKQKRVRTQLNGVLKGFRSSQREVIPHTQLKYKAQNSIAPNFIHSLDAAHLMFTVNDMRYEYGVKNLHVVHDCFGVHPDNVDMLVHILKENFIEMYTGTVVLDSFIEDYLKHYLDRHDYFKIVEQRPQVGSLDINKVRESRFFFS
jgi:DNA-directed RNA polymerase